MNYWVGVLIVAFIWFILFEIGKKLWKGSPLWGD